MKHLAATLGLLVAIAVAAGFIVFQATNNGDVAHALEKHDALEWLRADFQLTEAQFAAIKELHDSYSVVCAEHCRDIQRAMRERAAVQSSPNPDPAALAAADRRVERLRVSCEAAIATHVRKCAALMSPEAGERYLALVLPKIKDFDHQASPDLQLSKHGH